LSKPKDQRRGGVVDFGEENNVRRVSRFDARGEIMNHLVRATKRFKRGLAARWPGRGAHAGQGLVEYALILILVSIAVMSAISAFWTALDGLYQYIINGIPV
jgi:Flp pilus assembly pilin Flp